MANSVCYQKASQGQARLRQLGINISDAMTADFARVAFHESRCQHYTTGGKVKRSFDPKNGAPLATGFSQILPTTAKSVNPRLDIMNETDNIALGLQLFNSLGSDPIIRRLAYVGGAGSWTIKEYKRTGKVSTARMYPKTNLKETYYDYVKSTGGFDGTATSPAPSVPLSPPLISAPQTAGQGSGQNAESGWLGTLSITALAVIATAGILFAIVVSED